MATKRVAEGMYYHVTRTHQDSFTASRFQGVGGHDVFNLSLALI